MKIIYILHSLNITAPNTIIINIIINLCSKIDDIFVISMYKSSDNNYKKTLEHHNIKYIEFNSYQDALLNLSILTQIVQSYNILHMNQYKPNELGAILHKFNPNIKLISTCHSVEDKEISTTKFKGNAKIAAKVRLREQKNHYQKHHRVIAVSREVDIYLKKIGCHSSQLIYNGINFDMFPRKSYSIKKSATTIHFCQVGHIMFLKNQLYSIKLVQYLNQKGLCVQLHLFGKTDFWPEYTKSLKKYVEKHNLSSIIHFYGEVKHKELFHQLNNMDIYLMPSHSEGLPLALLEANYLGLPAIVSNNGGMKEIIKNNVNGLVIDINNKNSYDHIYNYCKKGKYIEHGKMAKKIAKKKYSAKIMASKYLSSYTELLS